MVSSTVNVVRYSALFSGILYGWYHHRTLQSAADKHNVEHALHRQEKLVKEAKAAWKRKQEGSTSSVISDFDHPSFDLEAYLTHVDKSA